MAWIVGIVRPNPLKPEGPYTCGLRWSFRPFLPFRALPCDLVYSGGVDENRVVCRRCGWSWLLAESRRRVEFMLCESCRVRPALSVRYGSDRCVPWRGDFDEEDQPMLKGQYFLPGVRSCGHRDCVNPHHLGLD